MQFFCSFERQDPHSYMSSKLMRRGECDRSQRVLRYMAFVNQTKPLLQNVYQFG